MLPRMRTLAELYAELKAIDPGTAVKPYAIRRMILSGEVPCVMAGSKRLVNLDLFLAYLSTPKEPAPPAQLGAIRRVV